MEGLQSGVEKGSMMVHVPSECRSFTMTKPGMDGLGGIYIYIYCLYLLYIIYPRMN